MSALRLLLILFLSGMCAAADVSDNERRALEGDPKIAQDIARSRFKFPDREFWAIVAAENGDSLAQYNYGTELFWRWSRKRDLRDLYRAKFWMERAAKAGNAHAKEELTEIEAEVKKMNAKRAR